MSKALEVLNHYHNLCSQAFVQSGDLEFKDEYERIGEAIAELEAMEARIKELEAELRVKDGEFRTLQETAIRIDGHRIKLKEELDNLKDNA